MTSNPYGGPSSDHDAQGHADQDGSIASALQPLAKHAGWMKFLAILNLVIIAFQVIISFGLALIIAWLPIWLSVLVLQSANAAQRAAANDSLADARIATGKLGLVFMITGILTIVMVAIFLIAIAIGGTGILQGFNRS